MHHLALAEVIATPIGAELGDLGMEVVDAPAIQMTLEAGPEGPARVIVAVVAGILAARGPLHRDAEGGADPLRGPLDEELPPYLDGTVKTVSQKATGWSGSIGYEFDENARIAAGFQHYAFEGPAGACVTGITSVCDTLDANIGYLQTSISF
jgi:hypothetical protein